jgi:hypothetical protein
LRVDLAWARSSRRHRIGRAHARHVIDTTTPTSITTADGNHALLWVGPDDRGLELEIVAVILPNLHLVIHVMPTALRGGKP